MAKIVMTTSCLEITARNKGTDMIYLEIRIPSGEVLGHLVDVNDLKTNGYKPLKVLGSFDKYMDDKTYKSIKTSLLNLVQSNNTEKPKNPFITSKDELQEMINEAKADGSKQLEKIHQKLIADITIYGKDITSDTEALYVPEDELYRIANSGNYNYNGKSVLPLLMYIGKIKPFKQTYIIYRKFRG